MPSRPAALALILALLALPLALAPSALAHCPRGGSLLLGLVSTCPYNDELELAVDRLNAASDGSVAYVLVKDLAFHPTVVSVKSGGTVVWVYSEVESAPQHDPRGSGRCANAVDPLVAPELCVPSLMGVCFDVLRDDHINMVYLGQTYPVTFQYAAGSLQKSRGLMSGSAVGDATGAAPFSPCPSTTGYASPSEVVVPYHCGLHGKPDVPENMRGTIVVRA